MVSQDEEQSMRQTGKTLAYGGQAVIEGVMMRGRHRVAVAVRNPQGRIVIHEEELNPAIYRGPISQVPFLRGLTMLWDALGIGTRALMWSASVSLGDEKPAFEASPAMTAVSMSMSAGLVFVSPALASSGLARFLKLQDNVLTNVIEGLLRLGLVTGYIWAIGQMEQGKRLFQYHGAEHKTINAYEAGAPLTPESVKRYPLEHPRCGTAFLLTVMVISTFMHSLMGRPPFLLLLLTRVIMLPLIAGIAYEFIKFASANMDNPTVRAIVMPNLMMQRLTTREPDYEQIEVAIQALERVLAGEREAGERVPAASAAD
jgi:uncharacterized protein YqhQ